MDQPTLSDASNVTLLLTSHLGAAVDETSDDTLGPAQWHDFRKQISNSAVGSVGELLTLDVSEWPTKIFSDTFNRSWVKQRLSNASRLALELEELNQRGIWVTTEFEQTFPTKLTETLDRSAPPFLYVAGDAANFEHDAVGFVGSRDADKPDLSYTRDLVDMAIQDGYSIVSGGAKGVDAAAEEEGLNKGGPVIEFPAEGIKKCLSDETVRTAVVEGDLTVASMYRPDASWSVGSAMGRNKYIHGYGEYTIAVRSGDETGGTWAGATENLSNNLSTLLVCTHQDDAPGNTKLISKGAKPINPESQTTEDSFTSWVENEIRDAARNSDSVSEGIEESSDDSERDVDTENQSSLKDF